MHRKRVEHAKTYLCAGVETMLLRSAFLRFLSPSLPLPPALMLLNPVRLAAWLETMLQWYWLASLAHIIGPAPRAWAALGSRSRPRHESFISQSQWCVLIGRLPTFPSSSSQAEGQREGCSLKDVFGLVPMWAKRRMNNTEYKEIL